MNTIQDRMGFKSRDQLFLKIVGDEFGFVPIVSKALVELAKEVFIPDPEDGSVSIGQMKILAVERREPAGKPIEECRKVPVVVTLQSEDDLKVDKDHGPVAARQSIIQRVTDESLDQDALLTQEDLARLLKVSVRTIRRDISDLRKQGIRVQTRGEIKDIGSSTSHKTRIVEKYLRGREYTQIRQEERHSLESIKRYVQNFSRIVWLKQKGDGSIDNIRLITGVSERVIREYLELYERYNTDKYRDRLDEIIDTVCEKKGEVAA
jgi:DNA-binding transcriptional regulator YhcF (GntR family)